MLNLSSFVSGSMYECSFITWNHRLMMSTSPFPTDNSSNLYGSCGSGVVSPGRLTQNSFSSFFLHMVTNLSSTCLVFDSVTTLIGYLQAILSFKPTTSEQL